jgi:hypothetical protein
MTATGHFETSRRVVAAAGPPPIADLCPGGLGFRLGPCVDGSGLARAFFTRSRWSEQPCVRPVSAVHLTAGHPSADQVPVTTTHSTMLWPKWVVLIAGSTGSALRAVRPFQPSHRAEKSARSPSRRKCDGFFVALAPGHHGPCHPRNLVGERDGSNLRRSPR